VTAIRNAAATVPGARTRGSPVQDADFITALYDRNLAVIAVVTFVLLAQALRSLWLPVKALLLLFSSPFCVKVVEVFDRL